MVINDLEIGFDRTSLPHHTEIACVLVHAASNVTGFDIQKSSISVDGIGVGNIVDISINNVLIKIPSELLLLLLVIYYYYFY